MVMPAVKKIVCTRRETVYFFFRLGRFPGDRGRNKSYVGGCVSNGLLFETQPPTWVRGDRKLEALLCARLRFIPTFL